MEKPEKQDNQTDSTGESTVYGAITTLPPHGWAVAGLLAILPAAGFYFIIRAFTPQAQASFAFFYWIAATYVLLRKSHLMRQILKRTGVLMILEAALYILLKTFL